MTELTLKQCKEEMIRMWLWLRDNPDKEKIDYFKANSDARISDCSACDWDAIFDWDNIFKNKIDCEHCPIKWYATKKRKPENRCGRFTCLSSGSPYHNWYNLSTSSRNLIPRRIYATEVLKLVLQIKIDE